MSTGYLHMAYARSLAEFGEPLELPESQGWLLKRSIPRTLEFDGMGCYPILACEDWSKLETDLTAVGQALVSVAVVTDPFGNYTQPELQRCFQDVVRPYKEHFVVDLQCPSDDFVSGHHRRNARNALKTVQVEICSEPVQLLNEWDSLYQHLIVRHAITGLPKFSREAFAGQLAVPGLVAFRARMAGKTAGVLLWYVQGETGYYHLGAYSAEGYQGKASFALFWTLLEYFADTGLRWLSLGAGAGAGADGDGNDGLTRFKRGWATGTRTAFLCGRIFDPRKYDALVSMRRMEKTTYFPAYRAGEFG